MEYRKDHAAVTMHRNAKKIFTRGLYAAGGIAVMILVFGDVDVEAVTRAVRGIGWSFIGILAVYFIGCVFDVLAWQRLLPAPDRTIPFFRLLAIHIAGESFYRFIPAGAVVGDGMKIFLSRRHFHMEYSHAVSGLVLRKLFMGIAQVVYIGGAVVLGIFLRGSGTLGPLEYTGEILAAGLFVLFALMGYGMMKGTLCVSLYSLLIKLPSKKLRYLIQADEQVFIETDVLLRGALHNRRSDVLAATVLFFLNWMTELTETIMILFSLGAAVSVTGVMLFEPVISLVRSIAFIFPGGLGVMDAGYVSALRVFGLSNAAVIAGAFIVVKRSKEIFWIVIGIVLAMFLGGAAIGTIAVPTRLDTPCTTT